jgi:hypothetical protein
VTMEERIPSDFEINSSSDVEHRKKASTARCRLSITARKDLYKGSYDDPCAMLHSASKIVFSLCLRFAFQFDADSCRNVLPS